MVSKLNNPGKHGLLVVLALLLSSFLLIPFFLFLGFACLLVSVSVMIFIGSECWVISHANEWLLVTENGKMVKARVGLKTFKTPS